MSLHNLSKYLSDLGHREDALKAIEEAVRLWQQLVADHPAFTPDLSMSLNNLSTYFSGLGHQDGALKAIKEAVWLR